MNHEITGAALVAGPLKAQIKKLAETDGVSAQDISSMLGIPILIVEDVLKNSGIVQSSTENGEQKLIDRAAVIEDALESAEQDAITTLHEVCQSAASEGVRMTAAQKILEIRTGALRPRKNNNISVGVTIETMNNLIMQATEAHKKQLELMTGRNN